MPGHKPAGPARSKLADLMAHIMFSPPYIAAAEAAQSLRTRGYAVLQPEDFAQWMGLSVADLHAMDADWQGLPPDAFLKDGGRYRRRRHSCFVSEGDQVQQVPHRAHWQPVEYNALHGGMQRWFEPMLAARVSRPAWLRLRVWLARVSAGLKGERAGRSAAPWYLEAHQFRIDTTDGIGRPTPEGAHRDGVDLVAVFLVGRQDIKGGETRVFEAAGPNGQRFTLAEPWSLLLLDDGRMIHESTPIQPTAAQGHRDTLVVTCRAGGFQGDGVEAQPT